MSLLQTEDLTIALGGRELVARLNWQIARGECWFVLGQNGAGKTSLLYALAGLLKPAAGRVVLDGADIAALSAHSLACRRGLMPQQQGDAFSVSVTDAVLIGRTPYRIGRSWDSQEDRAAVAAAIAAVNLAHKAAADVLTLSGGERQRAALAALLVQQPEVMLLDEPTAHQDVAQQLLMMRLIRDLTKNHAVVASCHDINLAARFATHVLVLAEERHWLGPAADVLTCDILQQAFGCRFDLMQSADVRGFVAH